MGPSKEQRASGHPKSHPTWLCTGWGACWHRVKAWYRKRKTPGLAIRLPGGSPALDVIAVGTGGCQTEVDADQRGLSRPQKTSCDAGAFEAELGLYKVFLPFISR